MKYSRSSSPHLLASWARRAFSLLKRQGLLVYGRHDEVMIADVCRLCRTTGSH